MIGNKSAFDPCIMYMMGSCFLEEGKRKEKFTEAKHKLLTISSDVFHMIKVVYKHQHFIVAVKGRKMKRRKKIIALAVALAVMATGSGIGVMLWSGSKTGSGQTQKAEEREGTVQKGNLELTVSASGTTAGTTAYQNYNVASDVLQVASVAVSSGDSVKKGQTLLTLTQDSVKEATVSLQTALEQSQAAYEQAKVTYEEAVLAAKEEYETNLSLASTASLDYQDTLDEYAQKVSEARSKLEQAQTIINSYPEKIQTEKKQKAAQKKQLSNVKKKRKAQKKLVSDAQKKLEAAKKKYDAAKSARSELETVQRYLERCTQKGTEIQNLKQSVQQEYEEAQAQEKKQKQAYEKQQKVYNRVSEKLTAYEKQQDTINDRLQTYEEKLSTDQTALSEAKKNVSTYRADYLSSKSEQSLGKVSAAAAYAKSKKQYENARSDYQSALRKAKQTLQSAKASYQTAQKQKKALRQLLHGNQICASRAGTITAMSYEKGDMLQESVPIAGYQDSSVLNIEVSVDQADISAIHVGQEASVRLMSTPEPITGTVSAIETESSSDSVSSVSYTVIVTVTNDDSKLATGETANVSFSKGMLEDVLYVPAMAVDTKGDLSYVKVKTKNGTTKKTQVTIGEENGQFVEIKSGLKEGDTYVLEMES